MTEQTWPRMWEFVWRSFAPATEGKPGPLRDLTWKKLFEGGYAKTFFNEDAVEMNLELSRYSRKGVIARPSAIQNALRDAYNSWMCVTYGA